MMPRFKRVEASMATFLCALVVTVRHPKQEPNLTSVAKDLVDGGQLPARTT